MTLYKKEKMGLDNLRETNYKKRKQRVLFLVLFSLVMIGITSLVIVNFRNNLLFFFNPTEIIENINQIKNDRIIRIGGIVKENSLKKNDDGSVEFIITDMENEVRVYYNDILPDLFRDNQGVIAKGFLSGATEFEAIELLTKHDEKYMPPEVKRSLESREVSKVK